MRTGGSSGAAPTADEGAVEGVGEAAGGRVTATITSDGRLDKLELDQRAMRLGSQDLAEQIAVAVNAALDDLRAKSTGPSVAGAADPAALAAQVQGIQDQSLRQMESINQSIAEVVAGFSSARTR
jgi:hypothetical protein